MRTISKKVFLALSSVLCSVCLLLGGVFAFSQTTRANAADLASEFTNNGQFTVSKYNGAVPFEYVDGGAEGLPAGYSGSVMKITTTSNVAYATLDFSAAQIKASDVESVVVRMYSPEYTAADEFRTNVAADGSQQVQYGVGAHDMSTWCDITLNATSMVTLTDANGYLALVSVGARVKGGATVYYIDSVTVNMKRNLETEFTNDGQFAVSYYTGNAAYVYEFVDGTGLPAGYDGSVLRIVSGGGAGYVNLDFTASKINAAKVESVVARVYSPDYTAEDELRINNVTSSLGGAGAHDLSTWCDIELPLNLITGADGNLGSFGFGLRDKGTISAYFYIDSITVTMKETTKVTLTGVHSYWNNYVHDNKYCSILDFSGGIQKGNLLADYSDVFAKATIDGQPVDSTNLSFICRAWIDGGKDSIVMRWVTLPAAGAVLHIPAGATFVNGSEDSNLYEIAEDIYLQLNGTTWVPYTPPAKPSTVPVTFTNIHSMWNNYAHDNSYCSYLQFSGGISGNGDLDADFSDLLSKMTMNGEAVDTSNVSFRCPNWIGASGGIILRIENNPVAGTTMVLPAGATFTIGGSDTNLYEITETIHFRFNGTSWAVMEPYGTPTFGDATAAMVGAWDWNHQTTNTGVIKDTNYGYTIIADWALTKNDQNLAATDNLTSRSIKLNGVSFYDLYQADDGYRLNAQLGYFAFSVPTAALVATNGYDYPTIEIANGTPFYAGNYLPETTLIYKNGAWKLQTAADIINYDLHFVALNAVFNNDGNGFLVVQFDTTGWEQGAVPTSYTGITYNGNDISDLVNATGGIKFYQAHSVWFTYKVGSEKLVAGYNGYSHPTIKIAEGATVVYNGKTYTFHEITFYLSEETNKWTTEKPVGWTDDMPTPVTYAGIAWNNIDYGQPEKYTELLGLSGGNLILISYTERMYDELGAGVNTTNAITAQSDVGNKIAINGIPLKDVEGAYVCLVSGYLYIYVPACEVLTIEAGTVFYGYSLPANTFYFSGSWLETAPEYKAVTFDHIEWNNYDYNNYGSIYGQENHVGTPSNGFCGLFAYSEDFGALASDANMATKYLDIGSKFKVNGIAAKDIPGAYISYNVAQAYLYFYIPFSGIDQADVYVVTIDEGAKFVKVTLPASTYYFYDGLFHETLPVVVTVQYGDVTVINRFNNSQTIDADYLANALNTKVESVCPLTWTIGATTYYAGDRVTVSQTTTVVVTEVIAFETVRGAAVRIANDGNYGIRFESRIGLDSYEALVAKYGESNIKTGTYIAPKALFDKAGLSIADYFAQAQGEGEDSKYVHLSNFDVEKNANGIYNKETYEADGYIQYFGSLTNLNDSNYYTQFFGVGYVSITMNGKTITVYGLTDEAKTNRTIYDVATMAYSDLTEEYSDDALDVLQHYIDSVATLTYSNGNLFVDTDVTGRPYVNAYTVSAVDGGYVITSSVQPKAIVINGRKMPIAVTGGEGAYSFTLATAYLNENFGSSIRYGLAEPSPEVWGDGLDLASSQMLADITQQMGATSYRVWVNNGMGGTSLGNVVALGTAEKNSLKKHVKTLVDAGVDEILFANGQPIMPYTYPSYYVSNSAGENLWVSREAFLAGGYNYIYYDVVAVPDPTEEPEAYATWLKVQYDYYVLFAAEVNAWKAEYNWSDNVVKFYFEGLNEPEFQSIIRKRGSFVNGEYKPAYFSTEALAQILTDVSYYMTIALKGCGEVTSPALTNITSDCDMLTETGVYCDTLLSVMYTKINDEYAPTAISGITPQNTNDENDYFTCLNWHPYLPWFKVENSKMYYGEVVEKSTWYGSTKKEAKVNSNYAGMWVDWNNNMYQIAVNGGDTDSPKVFFSEFGLCDWGNPTSSSDYRKILGINETLAANVFKTLLNNTNKLLFVDQLTVMAFRLFDNEELGLGEGNFGFINEQGQLKAIAKEYYAIINGNDDMSALQAVLDEYYK